MSRECKICDGKLYCKIQDLAPVPPKQVPTLPKRLIFCTLAGGALVATLLVPAVVMARRPPPQVANETLVAVRETVAQEIGVTLPPPPLPPPEILPDTSENVTLRGGAVSVSFTVVNP